MPTVTRQLFFNTQKDAGIPEMLIRTLLLFYTQGNVIDKNIMDYVIKMDWAGVGVEQITTILWNTVSVNGILNVPKFFREIGPLAKKWGFNTNKIKKDKKIFDLEIAQYATLTMTVAAAKKRLHTSDTYPIPIDIQNKILSAARVNPKAKNSLLYMAAIDMAAEANLMGWNYDEIIKIINKCQTPTGFNTRRMMRLTTRERRNLERKSVSRTDGVTIKPRINMRDLALVRATYNFFTENTDKIRDIASKYTGIAFFDAFCDLFTKWNGWPIKIEPVDSSQCNIPTNLSQGNLVFYAVHKILGTMPNNTEYSIARILEQQFATIVPNAKYELPFERISRVR